MVEENNSNKKSKCPEEKASILADLFGDDNINYTEPQKPFAPKGKSSLFVAQREQYPERFGMEPPSKPDTSDSYDSRRPPETSEPEDIYSSELEIPSRPKNMPLDNYRFANVPIPKKSAEKGVSGVAAEFSEFLEIKDLEIDEDDYKDDLSKAKDWYQREQEAKKRKKLFELY